MSRKKRMQSVREAKDRRAKKLAIGGGILLAALLAWELPHYLGGHKSAAPPATTTATTGVTTPTTTPPATTTATAGVTPASVPATPTGSTKLPNSDLPPGNSKGQLFSYSTFASKDPFDQQVTAESGLTGPCSCSGSGSTSATPASTPSSSAPVVTSARTLAHSGAVTISVNGKRESVRVGSGFPSANPVFRLVSLSRAGARIGIADGSYTSGAQTISLGLHRSVTLVDTATGTRYKLQLLGS